MTKHGRVVYNDSAATVPHIQEIMDKLNALINNLREKIAEFDKFQKPRFDQYNEGIISAYDLAEAIVEAGNAVGIDKVHKRLRIACAISIHAHHHRLGPASEDFDAVIELLVQSLELK